MGTKLLDRNDLKAAVHFKRDRHEELDEGEPELSFKDEYYSVALEIPLPLTDRWHVVAAQATTGKSPRKRGLRQQHRYHQRLSDRRHLGVQPSDRFYHNFSDTDTAYVTIARKSRLASLKDRYSYRMGTALPNPGLDPEIAVKL
jgi:iron complex outermembrane receptor protein